MAPVIAQMSPASQGEGQLLKHPLKPVANFLRGCLKSPDSRQILSSMCSLQLPESWHEACTTFCELGIGRTFQTSSQGVNKVTFVLIKFMLIMVPVVMVITGITKGDWKEA